MEPSCSICIYKYDSDAHEPWVLSCGHTFCHSCILKIKECPLDKISIIASSMKPNFEVKWMLERFKTLPQCPDYGPVANGKHICSEHRRVNEYFCVKDSVSVCANCLIKGAHSGHESHEIREVYKSKARYIDPKADKIFDELGDKSHIQKLLDERMKSLNTSESQALNKIYYKSRALIDGIKQSRKLAEKEIQGIYQILRNNVKGLIESSKNLQSSNQSLISQAKSQLSSLKQLTPPNNFEKEISILIELNKLEHKFNSQPKISAKYSKSVLEEEMMKFVISQINYMFDQRSTLPNGPKGVSVEQLDIKRYLSTKFKESFEKMLGEEFHGERNSQVAFRELTLKNCEWVAPVLKNPMSP